LYPNTNLPSLLHRRPFFLGGYGGQQVCPFTTGEQYLQSLNFKDEKIYMVWWFLVIMAFFIAFQVCFLELSSTTGSDDKTLLIQLLALRAILKFYHPPPPPREMKKREAKEGVSEEECTANVRACHRNY